jgi:L-alanine-DL-glutamate epimerase-like enolase superfamily enzyme
VEDQEKKLALLLPNPATALYLFMPSVSPVTPALNWSIQLLELPLKYTWKIARNSSEFKTNCLIRVTNGLQIGRGEVAPNVRYGESATLCVSQFEKYQPLLPTEISEGFIEQEWAGEDKLLNALRFGIRSAYLDLVSKSTGKSIAQLLNIPEVTTATTCFSLPIMEISELEGFIESHKLHRFKNLKVKVNKENAVTAVKEVYRIHGKPLLLDGNEAWQDPDELLNDLKQLRNIPVLLVEQPMPANLEEQYRYLKPKSPFQLLADESLTDAGDFKSLSQQFHAVNVKLMKAGNPTVGLQQLQEAKANGLQTMIGCMIETSLGLSMAFHLAAFTDYLDLDGFLHLQKDPFGLLMEENGELRLQN